MEQRQLITADNLEAMIEAKLRELGCYGKVKVTSVGPGRDWAAGVGADMSPECKREYIAFLSRLKRGYILDNDD